MGEKRGSLRERAAQKLTRELELPALIAEPRITVSPGEGITVCGVQSIREYDSGTLLLRLEHNTLRLVGEGLTVGSLDGGVAVIHGALLELKFTEGGVLQC